MDVSLADSGFVIKRYDGLEAFEGTSEDDENQPDGYLSGNGSASLQCHGAQWEWIQKEARVILMNSRGI